MRGTSSKYMVHVYVEMGEGGGGGCMTYIIFIIMNKLEHELS